MHPYLRPRLCCRPCRYPGSGEDGLLSDETQQEQDDALEVIAWLAAQPGAAARRHDGDFWGGFNALQVAARRPPALKAIS
jgi:predicted acyl esterase